MRTRFGSWFRDNFTGIVALTGWIGAFTLIGIVGAGIAILILFYGWANSQ